MAYGMHAAMDSYVSRQATKEELADFHAEDYLEQLQMAKVMAPNDDDRLPYNLGNSDCPVFDGLFNYCSMYSGASIDAARKLCNNQSDIAINWSGGLHHAKKAEASGFCYVNDIVLAIVQLLRHHPRVLYIDIDVHHGDGVEEAFWSSDRVLTLSIHKYDSLNFFPGTGDLDRTGPDNEDNRGAHHAVNVPLNDGIDDESYLYMFKTIVQKCVDHFVPTAIVLQCGADSLAGDRLGRFNVKIEGHGACVAFCKSLNIPLLLVGGGGYTPRNVARCWAYETSVAIGAQHNMNNRLPEHTPFISHFGEKKREQILLPTLDQIQTNPQAMNNKNTQKRLREIIESITEQLRFVNRAPSVQSKAIPPDLCLLREEVDDKIKEDQEESDDDLRRDREEGLGVPMEY